MVRITQNLLNDRTLFNLQRNIQRLTKMQDVVSTGRSINRPVDDPVRFPVALSLRSNIQQTRSFQKNIDSINSNLELSETVMNSLTDTLQTIRGLAVQGGNNIDVNARISISKQVEELFDHIVNLANTNFNGQSLFGGSVTRENAFTVKDNAFLYHGDDFKREVLIGKKTKITNNINGFDTFLHTPNQITSSVRFTDTTAPLAEQLKLLNPQFPHLPTIPSSPQGAQADPSPNPDNFPSDIPNRYASFFVYGTEIRVDLTADSLEDVVKRINATTDDVVASLDDMNRLVITSKRTDALDLRDGTRSIGFQPDPPFGLNLLSALGMHRQIEGTRSMNRGYPATDPLTDGTVSPAPTRKGVRVQGDSFLFVTANTGPDDNPAVPFGDNLALTDIDTDGNDALLSNGDPDFINELEALRITIDDEVIDLDLRSLTEGRDFDSTAGNEDDVPGSTLSDLLDLINNHPRLKGKATAYINKDQTGINISAVQSTDVFKVENVRALFGRDITRQVSIDTVTNDVTVTDIGPITMDTKLDDLPGALVDTAVNGSTGIRRNTPPPPGSPPNLNRGLIAISNDGENTSVDLRDADTIGDVIRAINNSTVGVEARINETGTGIDILSTKPGLGELSVVDMFTSTTARDLGLFRVNTPVQIQSTGGLTNADIVGVSFPTVSDGAFEIEVRDAAGVTLDSYSIDVSTTDTIADVVKAIDEADGTAGPGGGLISAFLSGGVLNVVSNYDGHTILIDPTNDTTGTDATTRITSLLDIDTYTFTLEADTPPLVPYESKQNTASILGLDAEGVVDEVEEKNIFRTVKNLERALRNNQTEGINQALEDIDLDLEKVLNQRSSIGARLNRLEAVRANLGDGEEFMRQELSSIEDADLAESISELTLAQNAFNAALSATSRVIQQSLLDFLR